MNANMIRKDGYVLMRYKSGNANKKIFIGVLLPDKHKIKIIYSNDWRELTVNRDYGLTIVPGDIYIGQEEKCISNETSS